MNGKITDIYEALHKYWPYHGKPEYLSTVMLTDELFEALLKKMRECGAMAEEIDMVKSEWSKEKIVGTILKGKDSA